MLLAACTPAPGQSPNQASAPTSSARPAATNVVRVRPVGENGQLTPGFTVLQTVSGEPSQLDGSSCTGSDFSGKAYRCAGQDHRLYDPCWTYDKDAGVAKVLCMLEPWSTQVVQIVMQQPLTSTAGDPVDVGKDAPWGVGLADGKRCVEAIGALDEFNGQAVRYFCDDKATYLLGEVNRSAPQWTFQSAHYESTYTAGPVAAVMTAWFPADPD